MNSPYLNLPLRSEEEVREAMCEHQAFMIAAMMMDLFKPTPAQRWLESIGPKLEQFRKEDGDE